MAGGRGGAAGGAACEPQGRPRARKITSVRPTRTSGTSRSAECGFGPAPDGVGARGDRGHEVASRGATRAMRGHEQAPETRDAEEQDQQGEPDAAAVAVRSRAADRVFASKIAVEVDPPARELEDDRSFTDTWQSHDDLLRHSR